MAKEMEPINHLVLGHLPDRRNPLLNQLPKQQNKERNEQRDRWLSQVLVQSQESAGGFSMHTPASMPELLLLVGLLLLGKLPMP